MDALLFTPVIAVNRFHADNDILFFLQREMRCNWD